jgi:DNA-binding CsgD family transcriptional regulator
VPTLSPTLTDRQTELLTLLAADHTLQSAADAMSISRHTAKAQLSDIFLKLRVHKATGAVARAIALALIPPPND